MRRRGAWRGKAACIGLAVLGLAACGTPGNIAGTAAPGRSAAETPTRQAVLSEGDRLAAVAPAATAAPVGSLPGPERLAGLTGTEVSALLGPPGFVRRDPPAEVWQYRTESCVLDLFLYADGADLPLRVDYFEFRGRTVSGVAATECYRELLVVRARGPAG